MELSPKSQPLLETASLLMEARANAIFLPLPIQIQMEGRFIFTPWFLFFCLLLFKLHSTLQLLQVESFLRRVWSLQWLKFVIFISPKINTDAKEIHISILCVLCRNYLKTATCLPRKYEKIYYDVATRLYLCWTYLWCQDDHWYSTIRCV